MDEKETFKVSRWLLGFGGVLAVVGIIALSVNLILAGPVPQRSPYLGLMIGLGLFCLGLGIVFGAVAALASAKHWHRDRTIGKLVDSQRRWDRNRAKASDN